MREEIISEIEKEKIIVIIRGVEKEKLILLSEALYEGGIRLIELTFDAKGIISDEETSKNIEMLVNHFENRLAIGAGTVITKNQVELTKKAGGKFIISPDTCPEIISKTREIGLVSVPGALTPSEMQLAHKNGADFVKLFPVANLGIDYVKAVLAPLSHIKSLAVGGINENNIKNYLNAGVYGFGIGTNIVDKKALAVNDYKAITELSRKYVSEVR